MPVGVRIGGDIGFDAGSKCRPQAVLGVFQGDTVGGGQAKFVQYPEIYVRSGLLVGHDVAAAVGGKIIRPVLAQTDFQQRGDIFCRGGGGDGQRDACFVRVLNELFDAGTQRDKSLAQHRGVMRGLHLVQMFDEVVEVVRLGVTGQEIRDEILDALLAAGHLEQLVIQRDIPVPVQAVIGKGLVERLAVSVFGVGEGAVDVKYDGFDSHSVDLMFG